MKITKHLVQKYENVRASGKYNMITDANIVSELIGCDVSDYFKIIENYSYLTKNFKIDIT